ncbi:hypothetical protein [Nocardia sp. NPDC049149]|uniref:hypothetical protein n=1 Tax=Nocardia sp. NPDC049149 TaxID=3364315 RepID=UPI00372406C5
MAGAFTVLGVWAHEQVDKTRRADKRDRLEKDLTLLEKYTATSTPGSDLAEDHRAAEKHTKRRESIEKRLTALIDEDESDGMSWFMKIGTAIAVAAVAGFFVAPVVLSLLHWRSVADVQHPGYSSPQKWSVAVKHTLDNLGDDPPCGVKPEPERSPRGALLEKIGNASGPLLMGECDPLFSFALNKISAIESCRPESPDETPTTRNGRLLRLDFTVRVGSEALLPDEVLLASKDFYAVDEAGRIVQDVQFDIARCIQDGASTGLSDPIRRQNYNVAIVVDVPIGKGYIGYRWKSRGWDGSWETPY